jgi:hypothetical protein
MQVIGKDHKCVDGEGMTLPRRGDRFAQARDLVDEQGLPPLQQIDREEEAPTRDAPATIIRHQR